MSKVLFNAKNLFVGCWVRYLETTVYCGWSKPVWPVNNCQISVRVAKNDFKVKILTPLQKLPKNIGDLGKLIEAKGFEKLPKVQ